MNREGYGYRQCRRKGQLTDEDLKKRLAYAKEIKKRKLGVEFWTKGIGFYVDGVSFVHKKNPCAYAKSARTRSWRKCNEGLLQHCTGKAKKEGSGGSVAKFMVSIAYGKGVIGVHQYEGSINGEKYAEIVRKHFPELKRDGANPSGGYFVQDNDPSQNSRKAKDALQEVKAHQFAIPPRSPDLNPIENIFHLVSKKILKDGKTLRIENETFEKFAHRCKKTLEEFPRDVIDRTIESMDKRIQMVIDNKGQRTKY
jgi:transposase